jgi:hypothetical protein
MLESRALRGAVAQLGERRVRNAKVEGSIPFRSTRFSSFFSLFSLAGPSGGNLAVRPLCYPLSRLGRMGGGKVRVAKHHCVAAPVTEHHQLLQ